MTDTANFSDRHFLVVDDEEYMARVITRMLKACHAASVIHANDGVHALQMSGPGGKPPDCVICDFNMKHVNGLQFLQGIRLGLSPTLPRDQPFIMVTGHGEQDVVKAALSLNVSGFAVKPVAQKKLVESIEKALSHPVKLQPVEVYKAIKLPKP